MTFRSSILLLLLLWVMPSNSAPIMQAADGEVTVTLHDDKCALREVTNLPAKAVWREKGKEIEGCWGLHPIGVVLFYFTDKTVAVAPRQSFQRVTGT